MTALGGFWSVEERYESPLHCRAMLAAQSRFGSLESAGRVDGLALGIRLHPILPEDEHDAQPLIGGHGRFALVADVRLDNRAELAQALGLDPAQLSVMADSAVLLLALERWG